MEIMNKSEAAQHLGISELPRYIALRGSKPSLCRTYYLPTDATYQTVLARSLAKAVASTGTCWLEITYWSNDSDSNQDLFYGYRRGCGDQRSLAEASVYRFASEESDCLGSILSLVVYFGWDARIFDSEFTYHLRVNNDGFLDYDATDEIPDTIERELSILNLSEMVSKQ